MMNKISTSKSNHESYILKSSYFTRAEVQNLSKRGSWYRSDFTYLYRRGECFMISNAVPRNLLMSHVLVFFRAFVMEILHHCNVCCTLTVAGLIVKRLCKDTEMAYRLVQKWSCGRRHRLRETREKETKRQGRKEEERTSGVLKNRDWCFKVRTSNGFGCLT